MDDFTKWISGTLIVLHLIKTALNWTIHNMLNPQQKVEFRLNHPGNIFEKDGVSKARERNLMFVYCNFIFFWLKTPSQKNGRIMAWSVLIISIIYITGIILLINYGESA